MAEVFIVSACRTPIGSLLGQFGNISAVDLAKSAMEGAIERSKIAASDIDEVFLGNVLCAGKGQNPARQASLKAGLSIETPAITINMLCGSGLKAVVLGYNVVKSGDAKIILCGGTESMSQAEHSVLMRQKNYKLGNCGLKDTILCDGLTDAMNQVHMGVTAEEVAKRYSLTRAEQDQFAFDSQCKAGEALSANHFAEEIVSVPDHTNKLITLDEYPQPSTTVEKLAKLKPVFVKCEGTVTAGNASGINDGAAAVIIAEAGEVEKRSLKPLARIVGYAEVGIDPMIMGVSPIKAIKKLVGKVGWDISDVDIFEINEAFASQSIAIIKELGIDKSKVNVAGGAIALGHPIGASGARVLVTLIYNLRRLNKKKGICALCVGGGMGIAMAIENCSS